MKKTLPLLTLALSFALISCSPSANSSSSSSKDSSSSSSKSENHSVDLPLGDAPTYEVDSISFHYWRNDGKYTGWDMWLWEDGKDGDGYEWNGKDDWGVIAAYPLSTWAGVIENGLGFIIRKGGSSWAAKDCGDDDKFISFSDYEKDENGVYNVYMISGDSNIYTDKSGTVKPKMTYATFTKKNVIAAASNVAPSSYEVKENGKTLFSGTSNGKDKRVEMEFPEGKEADYAANYEVTFLFPAGSKLSSAVSKTRLFEDEEFGTLYNYDGSDLGISYSESSSSFAVWSPLSNEITLRVYDSGTPASLAGGDDSHKDYPMSKGDKGVYRAKVDGDLAGKYYTYIVTNGTYSEAEVVDPYAKGCGVNGLRGMIVDFSKTNPEGWDNISPLSIDRKAMVVYETHVADVTSSSSWTGDEANRKKYAGMYEEGTTYSKSGVTVKTGFDHIKELGVNAVQIIPIFDQANDELNMSFNWGYNPLNYNCLEGGYSSDPKDGYARIKEFKTLVKKYNEAGMNIIMDVVYNHVAGATKSNFDVLMPGYYFRYTNNMALSNGSGCGNETASEHYMMRKFIVDSSSFWAKEYKLGGFRFDLMGLHDLTTMDEVAAKAKAINPNIVIYGEPWQGGTSTLQDSDSAKQVNGNKYVGYGQFNDQMRDALIRGGLSGDKDLGWVTDRESALASDYANKLLKGIKGITSAPAAEIADPDKTVSYVTCHDNYTLADRIAATGTVEKTDTDTLSKMNMLANSVVFTSQGTSFMLAGEEILRSKGGDKNSYSSSYKVNELDYSLKIEHADLFESYQQLIDLKKNLDGLHLDKDGIKDLSVTMNASKSMIAYDLKDTENGKTYRIIHKNGLTGGETVDLSSYSLYWSTIDKKSKTIGTKTEIKPFETLIVSK